jgi:hypothetical protein
MSKFLFEASLTTEGVKGVQSEGGTARKEAVTKAVESVGGRLDSFFFGDRCYVIATPDNESGGNGDAVNPSGAVHENARLRRPRRLTAPGSVLVEVAPGA